VLALVVDGCVRNNESTRKASRPMIKHVRLLAAVAASAIALSACGSSDESSGNDATSDSTSSSSSAFPATVTTKFGDVTVEKKPTRVVALGWGDAETALELGVQPVGASDWLGFGGDGVGPWSEGAYDKAPEIIETLEPSYEKIAALEPDLILDVRSSGDQDRYDKLSSIAPTIGVPEDGDNYLTDTEEQVTMIATALGETGKGQQILDDVDAQFEKVAADHPDWKGKTMSVATRTSEGWGAYTEGEGRVGFLEKLGFTLTPKVAALKANASGFSASVSDEQLDLLDADLVVAFPIFIDTTEITGDAQWKAIPAVKAGHSVVIDGDLSNAYSENTPGAQKYALEQIEPLLVKALGS
jgi:iron complex transport system substrate-binding protein